MKVNPLAELIGYSGKALQTDEDGQRRPMLLRDAVCAALTLPARGDLVPTDAAEGFKRHALARKFYEATGEIDVTSAEVAKIQSLITQHFAPLVIGPAYQLLEGTAETAS